MNDKINYVYCEQSPTAIEHCVQKIHQEYNVEGVVKIQQGIASFNHTNNSALITFKGEKK